MKHRVAVLTSGGDAPGMNACVRAVVRTGIKFGYDMFVIYDGYKGLVEGNIEQVDRSFVSDIINRGGTILKTARLPEFKYPEVQEQAIRSLKKYNIDSLVVIGGDGTYRGAAELAQKGVTTIGIPATIDNDVASTDFTIGYDTCLNTICECVDKIRDTTTSHSRCTLIEVMGRHCGDLGLNSGIAEGCEMIITPDLPLTLEQVCDKLRACVQGKKKHAMIMVSEHMYENIHDFARQIEENTGIVTRAQVLGHIQRGGSPSADDRILASCFGVDAIKAIEDGESGVAIGIRNNYIIRTPFEEALKQKRDQRNELLEVIKLVNR